jgi:hypothetical protein
MSTLRWWLNIARTAGDDAASKTLNDGNIVPSAVVMSTSGMCAPRACGLASKAALASLARLGIPRKKSMLQMEESACSVGSRALFQSTCTAVKELPS